MQYFLIVRALRSCTEADEKLMMPVLFLSILKKRGLALNVSLI